MSYELFRLGHLPATMRLLLLWWSLTVSHIAKVLDNTVLHGLVDL